MIKAQYTVVLKSLLDSPESKALIEKALSTYPLYVKKSKEEYIPSMVPTREQLNKKILDYYKYREIGFETPARFFDELEIAMNEIMPYYNQLFLTTDNDFNMIYNVDYTRDIKRDLEGSGTMEQNATTTSQTDTESKSTNTTSANDKSTQETTMGDTAKMVHADTPQSELGITANDIDNVSYADSVQWNKNDSNSSSTTEGENSSTGTTTSEGSNNTTGENSVTGEDTKTEEETTSERVMGNYGQVSYQRLIAQYREIILNVEQKIIRDRRIQELFMLVY